MSGREHHCEYVTWGRVIYCQTAVTENQHRDLNLVVISISSKPYLFKLHNKLFIFNLQIRKLLYCLSLYTPGFCLQVQLIVLSEYFFCGLFLSTLTAPRSFLMPGLRQLPVFGHLLLTSSFKWSQFSHTPCFIHFSTGVMFKPHYMIFQTNWSSCPPAVGPLA